jgi:hypothetical protein
MTQDREYLVWAVGQQPRPTAGSRVGDAGTLASMKVQDWSKLQDMQVQIIEDGRVLREGHVDMVAADGSVLWLAMDGVFGRQLILRSDGVEAWVHPGSARGHWIVSGQGTKDK